MKVYSPFPITPEKPLVENSTQAQKPEERLEPLELPTKVFHNKYKKTCFGTKFFGVKM